MTTKKKCRAKLSVRKDILFKKSSKKGRESMLLNKASELSELCSVDVRIICNNRQLNLVKTWPEDETNVGAIAERFSRLSVQDRNKKSTNSSRFVNKKMEDDAKASIKVNDNKLWQKLLAIEDYLKRIRENLRGPLHQSQNQDQTIVSFLLTNVDYPNIIESPADLSTTSSSSLNQPSNFSIFLYDHDNRIITQLPNSALASDLGGIIEDTEDIEMRCD